jgi:dipeptidyl aminopeptidase/acylaminoacyl peptidase
VLTHTHRFRAAVSLSGVSDLVSWRSGGTIYGDSDYDHYFVSGQPRMAQRLAEAPERYVLNSPVLRLGDVDTPLLLLHGVRDPAVHVSQAEEMFGLAQGNKVVELARYHAGDHDDSPFMEAAWGRALDWFDIFLRARPE